VPDGNAAAVPARRDRIVLSICVIAVTALAWAYLVRIGGDMSDATEYDVSMAAMGMAASPWGIADAQLVSAMWMVMMVGMMTPSAAPMLLLFSGTAAARRERRVPVSVLAFGSGYLAVWAIFSLAATLAQWALHRAALLSPAMQLSSVTAGGAVLVAAGIYEWLPLKVACLTHCRSPLGFLMTSWRSGVGGAFRMGAHHGTYCVACCWALMLVLFVVGVMNLMWVAILGVVVLLQKIGPAGTAVSCLTGTTLLIAGLVMIARAI
jgi:predicted metal-binding membrane protein